MHLKKRLRDETATVQKEIESCNQQLEALNKRLEGLRRADELFESERLAIAELLQAGTANGDNIARGIRLPAAKVQTTATKARAALKQVGRKTESASGTIKRGFIVRPTRPGGGLTRV